MGIYNNNNDSNKINNPSVINYRNNNQLIRDNSTTKRLCRLFNFLTGDNRNNHCDNICYHIEQNSVCDRHHVCTINSLLLFNDGLINFDLNYVLNNLCVSYGLNQIMITYDQKLKFIINRGGPSNDHVNYNGNGYPSRIKYCVDKYFQLLKFIDDNNNNNKINCSDDSGEHKNTDNRIDNFIKNNCSGENISQNLKKKLNILDYEVTCNKINNNNDACNLTIDDFLFKKTKTPRSDNSLPLKKNICDFCLTNKQQQQQPAVDNTTTIVSNNSKSKNKQTVDNDFHNSTETLLSEDNLVMRRDPLTKSRIKNLNLYRYAIGPQDMDEHLIKNEDDGECIYQPIWKWKTVATTLDDNTSDLPAQPIYAVSEDVSDSDNWSNAEHDFSFHHFSYIDENDNSLEYIDDTSSVDKSIDQIHSLGNSNTNNNDSNNNNNNQDDKIMLYSPYSRVTILYTVDENLIINNNSINQENKPNNLKSNKQCYNFNTNKYNNTIKYIVNKKLPKNVTQWQLNLLNYSLMEDEEDMNQTDISAHGTTSHEYSAKMNKEENSKGVTSFTELKIFGLSNVKIIGHTAGIDSPPEGKFTRNQSFEDRRIDYGLFKPIADSEKSEDTSVKSLNVSPKYSPTISEKNRAEEIKAKEKERKKEKDKVFGIDLDKVELDADHKVPRFMVECIKIVEEEENIETNGIYRASGNKTNIENIKKKMNEKRYYTKESKYAYLQNQDLHTITGALKLFFRETSDLIPEEVFTNLPKTLGAPENLPTIKAQINTLDEIRFQTLKYLMKHLRRVHEKNSKNLMTSSNLSIIWGASLFAKSVNSIMSLIENDIMNRNVLIRVIIDNYDFIFNENCFSTTNISSNNNNSNSNSNIDNQR